MEMMNRAIEDASDFRDMMRKLQAAGPIPSHANEAERAAIQQYSKEAPRHPPRRRGENRQQYRARIYSKAGA